MHFIQVSQSSYQVTTVIWTHSSSEHEYNKRMSKLHLTEESSLMLRRQTCSSAQIMLFVKMEASQCSF